MACDQCYSCRKIGLDIHLQFPCYFSQLVLVLFYSGCHPEQTLQSFGFSNYRNSQFWLFLVKEHWQKHDRKNPQFE